MKVDVLRFTYRLLSASCAMAFSEMLEYTRKQGVDVAHKDHGNALVHSARNQSLAAVRPDADYALMVDDDMLPNKESLMHLLEHGLPVVSALCTTRVHPVRLALSAWDPKLRIFGRVESVKRGKVITGPLAPGAAFLLLSRATIDAVIEYYLSARDWLEDNQRLFDRLHVSAFRREEERKRMESIRRIKWDEKRYLRIFDFIPTDDGEQTGEDITFARRLLALNIPVAVDTGLVVGHVGEYPYSAADLTSVSYQHDFEG